MTGDSELPMPIGGTSCCRYYNNRSLVLGDSGPSVDFSVVIVHGVDVKQSVADDRAIFLCARAEVSVG